MKRYAVKITSRDGKITYEAIGIGQSADPQFAHLYTTIELAEKKTQQYKKNPQWYRGAEIIEVDVTWTI